MAELLHEVKFLYDVVVENFEPLCSPQLGKVSLAPKIVAAHLATQKLVNESVPDDDLTSNNLVSCSLKISSPSLGIIGRNVLMVEVELRTDTLKFPHQGSLFLCK